jgi:hypothetical protein
VHINYSERSVAPAGQPTKVRRFLANRIAAPIDNDK